MATLPLKAVQPLKPLPARKAGRKAVLDKMAGVDMRPELYKRFGVDLTAVEGIGVLTGLILLTEAGPDSSRFRSEKLIALQKTAKAFGFELIQKQVLPQGVS